MHRWMRTTVLGALLVLAACGGGSSGGHAKVTCSPSGTHLAITAQNNAFDKACLAAPAGRPFAIAFDNRDPGVAHNVHILTSSGASPFQGDITTGVRSTTYHVGALKPGTYEFR